VQYICGSYVQEYQRQLSLNTSLKHELRQLKQQETSLLKLLLDHLASCPAPEAALASLHTSSSQDDCDNDVVSRLRASVPP